MYLKQMEGEAVSGKPKISAEYEVEEIGWYA